MEINATINPAMIAAKIIYHNIVMRIYCIYATKAATVIPIDSTSTKASVGIFDRNPTFLITCVITDTQNAKTLITARIRVTFVNNASVTLIPP